jgi:hypothetical protein
MIALDETAVHKLHMYVSTKVCWAKLYLIIGFILLYLTTCYVCGNQNVQYKRMKAGVSVSSPLDRVCSITLMELHTRRLTKPSLIRSFDFDCDAKSRSDRKFLPRSGFMLHAIVQLRIEWFSPVAEQVIPNFSACGTCR